MKSCRFILIVFFRRLEIEARRRVEDEERKKMEEMDERAAIELHVSLVSF